MDTLFPAPAQHLLCAPANGQAPQKSLHNVPTCLMSLKEEGTHNHDLKINSRRRSILVLGFTLGWWSHLWADSCHSVLGDLWGLTVLGLCWEKAGSVHRWQPFQPQSWWSWGRTLSWQRLAMGLPLANPSASLLSCLFSLLGIGQSILSYFDWLCQTQAKPMLGFWWCFRIPQMHEGRGQSSSAKTKLWNICHLSETGALEGDDHVDGFHHASRRALEVKRKKLGRGKVWKQEAQCHQGYWIIVWFSPGLRPLILEEELPYLWVI